MLLLLTLACADPKTEDTAAPADTAEDDTGEDSGDSGEDTAEEDWCTFDDDIVDDPFSATISASVVGYDGEVFEGLEVQACKSLCIQGYTDATGVATFTEMEAGCYKIDALGERVDGGDYGRIRVYVEVGAGAAVTLSDELFLPKMAGKQTLTSGTYTFGDVTWTVDASTIAVPFGYPAGEFDVGAVAGADVPALWDITAAGAVAFQPLASEVSAPFDLSVTGDYADGTYDVYNAGEHGELVGPIGTATATGGVLTATGIEPEFLTWILFSAQ